MTAMKFMSMFETITHVQAKDCIIDEQQILFIVPEQQIGKAIGKHGVNVKELERILKKKIKIIEFDSEALNFVRNVIFPLRLRDCHHERGIITLSAEDSKTRGILIGRAASNLRATENIVKRYFPIEEIKVL